jgi:hypothetical protein
MSGALQFLTFSLGAGLAMAGLRAFREGTEFDARAALKEGVRVWKTVADAAGAAQAEFDAFQAEVAAEPRAADAGQAHRRRIMLEPPS